LSQSQKRRSYQRIIRKDRSSQNKRIKVNIEKIKRRRRFRKSIL